MLRSYFTDITAEKYIFYLATIVYVVGSSLAVILEPFLSLPCNIDNETTELEFENSLFKYDPCQHVRHPQILFFTRMECQRGRNLLMAVFLGSLIGYERRQADRPAGIRTMALVSLGSALFTINSTFGFVSGPMAWDASRVSAAIPSGVGFLGAGLIVKSSEKDAATGERHHMVQGITTAAATWLSAAVGLACGGGLYFTASFSTGLNLLLLRFGPRGDRQDEFSEARWDEEAGGGGGGKAVESASYGAVLESTGGIASDIEKSPFRQRSLKRKPSLL